LRPTVKNKIALISPQGFLDSGNVNTVLNIDDIEYILKSDLNAVFISLKSIVFFNASAIQTLSTVFIKNIMAKKHINVGFCDYDKRKYDLLLKYLDGEPKIILLESSGLVSLFFGSASHESQRVLVWNDNTVRKSMILYKLLEKGCVGVAANSKEEFLSAEDNEYDYKVENCYLGGSGDNIQHYTKSNMVVYVFSSFLDSEITDTFDTVSHRNYLRTGFKVYALDCSFVVGINTHAINFLSRLAVSGAEYNATFVIVGFDEAKIGSMVKKELEQSGVLFRKNLNDVFEDEALIKASMFNTPTKNTSKKSLTKQTIKSLSSLVDSTIHTIEVMTKLKSEKLSLKLTKLDLLDVKEEFVATSIGFYGHIEGVVVLIFQKDIARKACAILSGTENIKDIDMLDFIGELINITMGKAKTVLSSKNLIIKMTLPKTFANISEIRSSFESKDGVLVDFLFENQKFMFFLTP